jgi:hypothetical protein
MYLGFSTPPITSKNDFSKYIELWTWGLVLSPITSKIDFSNYIEYLIYY